MEIILIALGISFMIYFITMSITAIFQKKKLRFKICIVGILASFLAAFIGYWLIPVDNEAISTSKTQKSSAVSSKIKNGVYSSKETIRINFINNGDNGCVLIQSNGENILVDTSKKDNLSELKSSLKAHMVQNLDYIILTCGDDTTMGSAAKLIKDYKVKDIKYIDDSVLNNSAFGDIKNAAIFNGITINKISSSYKIGDITVSAVDLKDECKVNFFIPMHDSSGNLKTMSFVKDDFYKNNKFSILHNVSSSCDSNGDVNVCYDSVRK